MAEHQEPFADVIRVEGGFSLPRLKWRELLFIGALREDGDRWVQGPRPAAAALPDPRICSPRGCASARCPRASGCVVYSDPR